MTDKSWDTPYIHGIDEQFEDTYLIAPNFTVNLSGIKHEITADIFLQACWTNVFNTPCYICEEAFDLAIELPVRLISLAQQVDVLNPPTTNLSSLSVENYHLRCLTANRTHFITVSHPWHASIAKAYANRISNSEAVRRCYEVPMRTLLAATRRFGPRSLLWHDYVSIPQWMDDFRGTRILPQVFEIFAASSFTILHVGYNPPTKVIEMPDLKTISEYDVDLRRFFNAHIFTRLWPIVEIARAGDAFVMDNEYSIMESTLSVFCKQILNATDKSISIMSNAESLSSHWTNNLPLFFREQPQERCLGYVYDIIANLGCRSLRDKFIGAAELLGISGYATELPENTEDACLWLCQKQITKNDLSPLLLRPSAEGSFDKCHWLKGHTIISEKMWSWGAQTHPARGLPQLHGHSLFLTMSLIGTVTSSFFWNLQPEIPSSYAPDALTRLLESVGPSKDAFLSGLASIDSSSLFHFTQITDHIPDPAPQINVSSGKIFSKTLRALLEQQSVSDEPGDRDSLFRKYNSVISLLALATSVPTPDLEHFESSSFNELQRHICDPLERTIVSVLCADCSRRSIFRAEIWQKPKTVARLYQIPKLTYQYTAKGGTGIIMDGMRIIGRIRFCASACDCNPSVRVVID
jgi:hypothetical protein